jgi:DNA-binding MarR family transcriptional regulator
VDRALGSGLVERQPPERGTRLVLVELTATGHREVERAVGTLLAHEQELVDLLAPQDQAELARLLAQLLASLAGTDRRNQHRPIPS